VRLRKQLRAVQSEHSFLVRVLGWRSGRLLRRKPLYFSTLRCPNCGKRSADQMPDNASVHFYRCTRCNGVVKPKPGLCCVYCSYGDVPCPWRQLGKGT
jgi:hypothetical protein